MRNKTKFFIFILVIMFGILIYRNLSAQTNLANQNINKETAFAKAKIAVLRKAAETLQAAAKEPLPGNLDKLQKREVAEYLQWLVDSSKQLSQLADNWEKETESLIKAREAMAQMNASFNLQFLQLQQKMQQESQRYTAVSNTLKVRHDTVKNALNNLR